jgi:hypothetical protein
MSIKETEKKIKPIEDDHILEGDFDIVPHGDTNLPWKKHIFSLIIVVLIAGASFGLGRIAFLENNRVPVAIRSEDGSILNTSNINADTQATNTNSNIKQTSITASGAVKGFSTAIVPVQTGSTVVASKSGTKYHYPWCSGAKQISPANKITFNTIEEARKAGYTPAANCKGLK